MHFEILIEDQSGKTMLEIIVPKIIDIKEDTFKIKSYKGIGHIPKNLKSKSEAQKRILLDQLPRLLKGYGKTFSAYPKTYKAVLIIVTDLDDRPLEKFKNQLFEILKYCDQKPATHFCFAIEEGEAWILGDITAIKTAYPKAKDLILNNYINDSICGTWETLADAIYPGGHKALKNKGWQAVGEAKNNWAKKISPNMDIDNNKSPSFSYFRNTLKKAL
ncbi:MAG: hypothetical protein H6680_07375 [Desulfobacteraceae bacterium]|nr:hypothetical protein [Desulfobacteraceae bacterium]